MNCCIVELLHSHNDCLSFTEVVAWPQSLCFKQRWAMLELGWVTTSVHYSCFWWLCARARGPKHLSAVFFFHFFGLLTFMYCGMATMIICLLQKFWDGHNGCVL